MKTIIAYIAARLKERSTWLGLIGFAGSIGLTLAPEYNEAIITAGVGIASAIAIITADAPAAQ